MMLVKLKNFWTLSMTEAGSVFSICPSKTNSWAGRTNSRISQREQEVDGLSRLEWCVECCIFHVCGVRVPDWSGNSWASAPDGWRTSLAPDSDSGGPVVLLAHRGLRWWHHGRSTLVPLGHRELFGAVERKQKKRKLKKLQPAVHIYVKELTRRWKVQTPTWYQEYALSAGLMRMVMILALGRRAAALWAATSESK